jgi:hypothetical protein
MATQIAMIPAMAALTSSQRREIGARETLGSTSKVSGLSRSKCLATRPAQTANTFTTKNKNRGAGSNARADRHRIPRDGKSPPRLDHPLPGMGRPRGGSWRRERSGFLEEPRKPAPESQG